MSKPTDWRELRRTTHNRRKVQGTVLDRTHEHDNPLREDTGERLVSQGCVQEITPSCDPMPEPQKQPPAASRHENDTWTPARIKTLRKRLGLSTAAFGKALGFTGDNRKVTIRRYECGMREPSAQVIMLMEQLENQPIDAEQPDTTVR